MEGRWRASRIFPDAATVPGQQAEECGETGKQACGGAARRCEIRSEDELGVRAYGPGSAANFAPMTLPVCFTSRITAERRNFKQ